METHRALVTGATGFVGSHLVRHLLRAEWQVHAIVRSTSDDSTLRNPRGVHLHEHSGSMRSMLSILNDAQPDVVFHLASLVLSQHQVDDIDRLMQSNILFGMQLVEAMTKVGARALVNTGTTWQHYQGQSYSPVNLYAATKQAFEDLLQYYVEAKKLCVVTLKLADTYGPDDPRPKIINLLRNSADKGESLLMSEGLQKVDLVHIDDVVAAYDCAARHLLGDNLIGHQAFSVSSGAPVSLKEVVGECERAWGVRLDVVWGGRPYREREVMSPWQGKALPGWHASVRLSDGLKGLSQSCDGSFNRGREGLCLD